MCSVLFQIGPLKLHSYGLMIALGFLLAMFLVQRDVKKAGWDPRVIGDIAFWAFLSGLLGTRLLHIIMFPHFYSWTDPIGWIALWRGGLVFQGAIPAAFLYTYIALRRKGVPFLPMADIVMPYMALAQAFGRVGCFLNGCCFGRRADELFWGVCFPQGSPPYMSHVAKYAEFSALHEKCSYPVHPTQLYSVLGLLSICGVLLLIRKHFQPKAGSIVAGYFILYGIMRFIVEMFRDDGNPTSLGFDVLSNQQMFCILMVVLGGAGLLLLRFIGKGTTVATDEKE